MSRSLVDVGVLRDTLLPNLAFHTALAVPAYAIARQINYMEGKDVLWSTGQIANAWYQSVGRHLLSGVPLSTALKSISRPGWLLLSGITLWGSRLAYRVISRRQIRGHDDPRYTALKKDPQGWWKAAVQMYLPEAIVQAFITLPVTAPFRTTYPILRCPPEWAVGLDALAIGLFGAGLAMEVMADSQLESFKQSGNKGVCKEGMWSVVRHPNYLGDALVHSAFPILLFAHNLLNPLLLLGPLANYLFLRYVGGDKENEASQEERYAMTDPAKLGQFHQYQVDKNAFWPKPAELVNKWVWICAAAGGAVVAVERVARSVL